MISQGPWKVRQDDDGFYVVAADGVVLADSVDGTEEDLRLMAASWSLAKAAETVIEVFTRLLCLQACRVDGDDRTPNGCAECQHPGAVAIRALIAALAQSRGEEKKP